MSARTDDWTFEWRRSWDDVWEESFVAQWRGVFEASTSAHVYHRADVVRQWANTIGAAIGAEPCVGFATSSAGAQAVLPWVVVPYGGRVTVRRTLEAAGSGAFGYHGPLVAAEDLTAIDWSRFWTAARAAVGGACDQALFRLVEPAFAADAGMRRDSEESPVLMLAGCADLDQVLARCSSSHRVDVKRQFRRARERGGVSLEIARPDDVASAVDSLRRELLPAYRSLWEGRSVKNTLLHPGVDAFLEAAVTAGVPAGWGHFSVLRIGGTPVAWHLGFLDAGRLYWWLPTHDAAWSNYSPGKLLLAALIDSGCHAGWREIHLLTGHHGYKAAWNPVPRTLTAVAWNAPTLRGRLMAWYDARARAS
jgi:CelD/BcsL family acetyltransferase involved in cellulose biosynthesis